MWELFWQLLYRLLFPSHWPELCLWPHLTSKESERNHSFSSMLVDPNKMGFS